MDDVRDHLINVWAAQGLECRSVGLDYLHAYVGPRFDVSGLCADIADKFDAVAVSEIVEGNHRLVITISDVPGPRRTTGSRCCTLFTTVLAGAALTAAAAWPW